MTLDARAQVRALLPMAVGMMDGFVFIHYSARLFRSAGFLPIGTQSLRMII
jgi:hypothetical protein